MQLDAPTLFVLMDVVMALMAVLLLWTWLQNRSVWALAWWGVACLHGAVGTALVFLRGQVPDWLSVDLSNALLIGAYGLIWSGARIFNGRSVHPGFVLGAVVWLVACRFDAFFVSLPARASLFSLLVGSYSLLAAWEFWREKEPLASRSAAVVCMVLHALFNFARVGAVNLAPGTETTAPLGDAWFVFIAFEGTLYTIAASVLLLAMAKERVELRYKTASQIDPLTGTFNRRSFFASARALLGKAGADPRPVAFVLFDLDHFKAINDTYGHRCGDEILRLFCVIAAGQLRADDLFGRLGGEEFAALLPGADAAAAAAVAGRILAAFEAAGQSLAQPGLETTASAGIAAAAAGERPLDELLGAADRGLYEAKRLGRNRVVEHRATAARPVPRLVPQLRATGPLGAQTGY